MTVTTEEFRELIKLRESLKSEDEIPDEDLGYSVIKPYKTKPVQGGTGFLFLKRIKERHLAGRDWIPTNALHDIYFSSYGSHVNLLIKLAKSKYLETKLERIIIDVETDEGMLPQYKNIRLWRLTKKSLKYLENYDQPFDVMIERVKSRAIAYLEKKGVEFEISYPYDGHGVVTFNGDSWYQGTKARVFRFKDLAEKPSRWQNFYNVVRWGQGDTVSKEDEAKFAEAEEWLQERSDVKTSIVTPIGTVSVDGDVRQSTMMLNDKRICVVPSLPVHHADIYICRLSWLNYDLDNLIKLIVREHVMVECPSCHSVARYGGVFQEGWIFCPICGAPIDEMIEGYILRRVV